MDRQQSEGSNANEGGALPPIPKKKQFAATDDPQGGAAASANSAPSSSCAGEDGGGNRGDGKDETASAKVDATDSKGEECTPKKKPARPPSNQSPAVRPPQPNGSDKLDPPILRKGDLVRVSSE